MNKHLYLCHLLVLPSPTAYYIDISFEVLSYGTLDKYSLFACYDLTSFPCINMMPYICIVFINLFAFCHNLFITVPIVILMTCSISI